MKKYCYFNGSVIPLEEAKIDVYDIGFQRGYAVFDYLKVYEGKPFLLDEHLKRFENSAKLFNLNVPVSNTEIKSVIAELIKKNNPGTCAIRIILSGGVSESLMPNKDKPTFLILIEDAHPLPEEYYTKGAVCITKEFDRPVWDAKHSNYSFAVAHQDQRVKAKAVEILYLWDGEVREATTSNIFIVKNNEVATPREHVLFGMTRNYIIDLIKKDLKGDIAVAERRVTALELFGADEVFITASNKEVVPIIAIDGRKIGDGKIGPITKKVTQLFAESVKKDLKLK